MSYVKSHSLHWTTACSQVMTEVGTQGNSIAEVVYFRFYPRSIYSSHRPKEYPIAVMCMPTIAGRGSSLPFMYGACRFAKLRYVRKTTRESTR